MNESSDFTKIAVKKSVAKDAYAYLLAPSSYQRVLGDLQLVAKLGGRNDSVAFVIRDKAGKLLREIPAVAENNLAKAVLSKAEVSSLGAQIASVEVMVSGHGTYGWPQAGCSQAYRIRFLPGLDEGHACLRTEPGARGKTAGFISVVKVTVGV